jgi:hypothetical protein
MATHIDTTGFNSVLVPLSALARGHDGPVGARFAMMTVPTGAVCFVQSQFFVNDAAGLAVAQVVDGVTDISTGTAAGNPAVTGVITLRITHPDEAVCITDDTRSTIFTQSDVDVSVQWSKYGFNS